MEMLWHHLMLNQFHIRIERRYLQPAFLYRLAYLGQRNLHFFGIDSTKDCMAFPHVKSHMKNTFSVIHRRITLKGMGQHLNVLVYSVSLFISHILTNIQVCPTKLLLGLFGLHGGLDQEPDDGDVGREAEELTPGADGPFATGDDPVDACEGEACADYAHEGSTSDEA